MKQVNVKFSGQNCYIFHWQGYSKVFKGPHFLSCCFLKLSKKHRLIGHIVELYPVG